MKISTKTGSIAFYTFMPSLGFFILSMLAWRGFYIAEAQFPNAEFMTAEQFATHVAPLYWENYLLLSLTIISLIIAITSVFVYLYSDAKMGP